MSEDLCRAGLSAMAVLLLSEALLLFAARNILRIGDWNWLNRKNMLLQSSDAISGLLLLLFTLFSDNRQACLGIFLLLIISLATSAWRIYELFSGHEQKYCNGWTLVIINIVKFIMTALLLFFCHSFLLTN